MRRELKPTLRQLKTAQARLTPQPDEEIEVVLTEGEDTILHFDGSPLMENGLVSDPEGEFRRSGRDLPNNTAYKDANWIAIGLGTDDAIDPNSQSPYRTPFGDIADGMSYTEIGPTRSALFFDTTQIPPDAIILEATLELTPTNDLGDVFDEQTEINVWPAEGVNCEVLTLSQDVTVDCTWNTKTGDSQLIDLGLFEFTVPKDEDRWRRTVPVGDLVLPNPIGMIQNSRRSDIGEPVQSFAEQRTSSGIPPLDEFYGHIGYGIFGGGRITNVPDINNPSAGHPVFDIPFDAWLSPEDSDIFSIDVKNIVEHSIINNGKCSVLLRASNWGQNTAIANPDEQVDEIDVVSLNSVIISESANGPPVTTDIDLDGIPDVTNDQLIHSVFQAENFDNATFEWYVEIPIIPLTNLQFTTEGLFAEGETVNINATVDGGDEFNVISVNWYNEDPIDDDGQQGEVDPIASGMSYTIPVGSGGSQLWIIVTASNPRVEIPSITVEDGPFNITFDLEGAFEVEYTPESGIGIVAQPVTATVTSTTGVANPRFNYEWTLNGVAVQSETNTTQTTSSYTPVVPEGMSILTVTVNLLEGNQIIGNNVGQWAVESRIPQVLNKRNGAFLVYTDNTQRNTAGGGPDLRNNAIIIESPACLVSDDPTLNGRHFTPEAPPPPNVPAPILEYEQAAHVYWEDQLMSGDGTTRTSVITAEGIGGRGIDPDVGPVPTDMAIYYPVQNIGWVYYRANRKPLKKVEDSNTFIEDTVDTWADKSFQGCIINTDPLVNQPSIQYTGWVKVAGDPDGLLHSPGGLLGNQNGILNDWHIFFFQDDVINQGVTDEEIAQWPPPSEIDLVEPEEQDDPPSIEDFVHRALYCPSLGLGTDYVTAITIGTLGSPSEIVGLNQPAWREEDFTLNHSYLGNRAFRNDSVSSFTSCFTPSNPGGGASYSSLCVQNRNEELSNTGDFIGIVMVYREVNGTQKPIAVITTNSRRDDNGNVVLAGPDYGANYGYSFYWSAASWGNIGRTINQNPLQEGDTFVVYEYASSDELEFALDDLNNFYGLGWENDDDNTNQGGTRGRLDGSSWLIPFASEVIENNAPDVLTELNFEIVPPCS